MENRFLGLIEKSVKVHWDLPALLIWKVQPFYTKTWPVAWKNFIYYSAALKYNRVIK